jgi:YD repeat-containing protein
MPTPRSIFKCFGLLSLLALVSCSKDTNEATVPEEGLALPSTIVIEGTGYLVQYDFTYNIQNQIIQIGQQRTIASDTKHFVSQFGYDQQGRLVQVETRLQGAETYDTMAFGYNSTNTITHIGWTIGGEEPDMDIAIHYFEMANSYLVTGNWGTLPTALDFDEANELAELVINQNNVLFQSMCPAHKAPFTISPHNPRTTSGTAFAIISPFTNCFFLANGRWSN